MPPVEPSLVVALVLPPAELVLSPPTPLIPPAPLPPTPPIVPLVASPVVAAAVDPLVLGPPPTPVTPLVVLVVGPPLVVLAPELVAPFEEALPSEPSEPPEQAAATIAAIDNTVSLETSELRGVFMEWTRGGVGGRWALGGVR
jgi:hypothetical protein